MVGEKAACFGFSLLSGAGILSDLPVVNFYNKNKSNSWDSYPHTTAQNLCVSSLFSEKMLCYELNQPPQYQIVICKRSKLPCKNEMHFLTKKHPSIHVFLWDANSKHEASDNVPSGCSVSSD